MGNFKVKFGIDSYYSDPEYRSIYVKVIGDAEVSFEGHDGSEKDQEFVKQLIGYAVMEALSGLSADQVSYKHIVAHKDRFISALKEQFAPKNITAVSFNLMNVGPDEQSRQRMAKIDQMKQLSKLSPEELAKKQQEAAEEAKRRWDALSPEEKARIEAENKRKADEAVEQMKKAQALAQKMAAQGNADAAAASTAASMAAMKAAALGGAPVASAPVAAAPKFCTNCGAPSKGGKFCGSCGKPL